MFQPFSKKEKLIKNGLSYIAMGDKVDISDRAGIKCPIKMRCRDECEYCID